MGQQALCDPSVEDLGASPVLKRQSPLWGWSRAEDLRPRYPDSGDRLHRQGTTWVTPTTSRVSLSRRITSSDWTVGELPDPPTPYTEQACKPQ